ncbi:MAG: TerB family tellurite resistance protein [Vulcanimicrobiota bacterium]
MQADVPKVAAALAASLIASDGVIEDEEREVAVEMGRRMVPGFSNLTFETLLEGLDDLPSAYELAEQLRDLLDDEDKDRIINYLVAIAAADRQIVEVENQELQAVADALGVPLPPLAVLNHED